MKLKRTGTTEDTKYMKFRTKWGMCKWRLPKG